MPRNDTIQRRRADYERDNREAAEMIAADPERYPGAQQTWARMTLARAAGMSMDETLMRLASAFDQPSEAIAR